MLEAKVVATGACSSKAKCQHFEAITFEPQGLPSLGCNRNSLAERKWVEAQSRHVSFFRGSRRQDTVHLPNAIEKHQSPPVLFTYVSHAQGNNLQG